MRSISRIVDVSINTVAKLLVDAGEASMDFHDEHMRGVKARRCSATTPTDFLDLGSRDAIDQALSCVGHVR